MSEARPREPRRGLSAPLVVAAALLVVVAVAVPQVWLTGELEPDDDRALDVGAWILRGAMLLIGVVLLIGARREDADGGARRASEDRGSGLLVLTGIFVAAAALRAFRLDAPLWFDEIVMVIRSLRPPLAEALRTFATDNDHPLYSQLARASTAAFGTSPWTLRLPAAIFGAASVAAVYAFARPRLGRTVAIVATAILGVSSHHIWFSQNARGYSGLLLFTVLSSHYLLRALDHGRRRDWMLHGVTLALCVMVHMTGVFTAVGQLAVIVWSARPSARHTEGRSVRSGLLGTALATALGLAAYALVLPQVVHFFLLRPDRVAVKADWTDPLWFFTEAMRTFGLSPWQGVAALLVGGAVGFVGLRLCWRRSPDSVLLLVVPAVLLAVVMVGLGRNLWPRLFFFLSGFAVLVAVLGLFEVIGACVRVLRPATSERTVTAWRLAAGTMLVAAFAATAPRAFAAPKQDYGAALRYVESVQGDDAVVATVDAMTALVYREYYAAGLEAIESPDDVRRVLPEGRDGFVVYSFPVFVESRHPEVWELIRSRTVEVARFPGSVGGGDVVVLRVVDGD